MTYDMEKVKKRVRMRKKRFLLRASIAAVIFLVGVAFLFVDEKKFIVSGGLLILLALFVIYKNVNKYLPKYLFSKEIIGVNIKEHEYVTLKNSRTVGGGRSARLSRIVANSERRKREPHTLALVYIRTENGDIKVLDGIDSRHVAIYEIGDTLKRYEGTRYPFVFGREVKLQPCPLCGEVNSCEQTKCKRCGLPVLNP